VKALLKGRSAAVEGKEVVPANDADIDPIERYVSRQVWAVICIMRLTGARASEILSMRSGDITMLGDVWQFKPMSHKCEHHGKQRVISIGPRCQELLKPWLKPDLAEFLFQPREAMAERAALLRARRQTPVQPSQQNRAVADRKRPPGQRYSVSSLRRAI